MSDHFDYLIKKIGVGPICQTPFKTPKALIVGIEICILNSLYSAKYFYWHLTRLVV
jgi:hypothetical protein